MDFNKLYKIASDTINPRKLARKSSAGHVAAALLTDQGNVYTGVCLDAACGLGYCAEQAAIACMLTAGESTVSKLVVVDEDGSIFSPCGRCRELLSQINTKNIDCEIMLASGIITLGQLLPLRWDHLRE